MLVACSGAIYAAGAHAEFVYPETRTVDQVDEFHGVVVEDPYRWLEGDVREHPEVAEWVAQQNEVTFGYLESIPEREIIAHQIAKQSFRVRVGLPSRIGLDQWVVSRRDEDDQFSVRYLIDDPAHAAQPHVHGRVLIDPNTWPEEDAQSLGSLSFSPDGRILCYGVRTAGSDWREWRFMDVETGEHLSDHLRWTRFTGASWDEAGEGVYYAGYPEPTEGAHTARASGKEIRYHRLGTPQSHDRVVFRLDDEETYSFWAWTASEGRYLMISVGLIGERKNELFFVDLRDPVGQPRPLVQGFDASYSLVTIVEDRFIIETDLDAPNGRLIAIDATDTSRDSWIDLMPEPESAIRSVSRVGGVLFVSLLEDAKTRVRVHRLDGTYLRDVDLPGIGTASGFGGKHYDTETYYSFRSFDRPSEHYRYDILTGESELIWRQESTLDPGDIEVEQVFFSSEDGARVPMFIARKKGVPLDGDRPTRLYGYGGFSIPVLPWYSSTNALWIEMGGVFAVANIRGGGEYGKAWHEAASKTNKQRSYDDFIAAAEYLIDNGYTRPERLAIEGGSNGGLLVGACMTQRPELFGAALPSVGVMDMLRYHLFTIGYMWASDFGTVDDADEFETLLAISPYHALMRNGPTEYPPTLVLTADTDDRVVPAHSFKFAAALQQNQAGDAPVLLRVETSAGHGGGVPLAKRVEATADRIAFLVDQWGLEIPDRWHREYEAAGAEADRTLAE